MSKKTFTSPWAWIPTLYIAEGLPYFAVNTLTVLMYTNMGVSKTEMAFFTGWLYLPWVIKPFWSPFIDLFKTKRWWILSMQCLLAIAMGCVAISLLSNFFFALTLIAFWIMAFASATHDISADGFYILSLSEKQQAAYVGVRSTFYRIASVLGQGGLVILAGYFETSLDNVFSAWSLTFTILSIFFLILFFYHFRILPYPDNDYSSKETNAKEIIINFIKTFITFFKKPHILTAILFMLLYRLPEAMCVKMVQPFLKDSVDVGGLGLTTSQIGFINGTIGVIALLGGGILGGVMIAKGGLKKWLWPMALSLTLPCIVYCYLASTLTQNIYLISSLIGIEQFGYGFGFTSFMLYMMYFSKGENSTSHYAFCTAFMALGMMLPGMGAGWLLDSIPQMLPTLSASFSQYDIFFGLVMLTTIITFVVTGLVYKSTTFDEV